MLTMTTASKILKDMYGPLLANQLNDDTSPFYKAVDKTSKYMTGGNQFIMATPIGLNGGVGAGDESSDLPSPSAQVFERFVTTPKSQFGVFRITDKAWRSGQTNAQTFTNLMKLQTQSLEKSTKWNLNRQLWQNGNGKMGEVTGTSTNTFTVTSGIQNFIEGQLVDFYNGATSPTSAATARKITAVVNKPGGTQTITVDGAAFSVTTANSVPAFVCIQGSYTKEMTGITALFDSAVTSLYGVTKSTTPAIVPYSVSAANSVSDGVIQNMLNYLQDYYGSNIDMIIAGGGAYTAYYEYLEATKRNIDQKSLAGGFSSIAYGDIPIVRDRFATDGDMNFLETSKWHLHQLNDWEWMEGYAGENSILQQVPNKPYYQATIVKHCDLMCEHPGGQGKLTNCN
jgi:hypothetical protein